MEQKIYIAIVKECEKLILRHHSYHNKLHVDWVRNTKRISDAPPKVVETQNIGV